MSTNELVGAWGLKAAQFVFDDGESVEIYGAGAHGRVLFTPEGWMAVVITGSASASIETAQPIVLAYSGRYRAEAGRFVTNIDVSSMTPWIGTEQARNFEVSGDTLRMVLPMPVHPAYPGRTGRGTLEWTRE